MKTQSTYKEEKVIKTCKVLLGKTYNTKKQEIFKK